ncbi:MAG: sugar phosphate nucleotidyltransferase [Planctomycetota bacterium]
MKGVVLAGGLGTRLYPLTKITNKHLLPVFDKPMIYYPIQCLVNAGITDILIVTGGNSAGDFLQLLGNGADFGLKRLNYAYQQGEGGIADALKLAENFADGEAVCVVLGDNIIEGNIKKAVDDFKAQGGGAKIMLKEVHDPERFGVATVKDGKVEKIVEKPKSPESNLAVIGIYLYDGTVFDRCNALKPSARGELEITDVNNAYIQSGSMTCEVLKGWWTDAGTFESLYRAATLIRDNGCNRMDI